MYQPVRYCLDNLHVLTSRNLNPRHNSRAHRDEANPTVPQCWEPVSHDVLKCDIVAYNFFPTKCGYLFFKTRAWLHLLLNLLPLFLRLVDGSIKNVPKDTKKGLNSLIILVAWNIWKHRNACVFESDRPCIWIVLQVVANESSLWCFAGASVVHELLIWSLNLGTEVTSCLVLPLVRQAKII